jgi:arylamine N-acetyltransferase
MLAPVLQPSLHAAVLNQLGCAPGTANRQQLERLLAAYIRSVPWESALRIVKRAHTQNWQDCARWPDEFWQDNLQHGAGGTCFESNFAFSALLRGLGYEGYLTINDMGESIGCHTAIIVFLAGQKFLVDVGYPVYTLLPLQYQPVSEHDSPFFRYTVRELGSDRYQIERRPHPIPYAFTLVDQPVKEDDYRQVTINDYGPDGHFLQRVIVHKIIDEQMWRFTSAELPQQFTRFTDGQRFDQHITGDTATAVAAKFGINEKIIRQALHLIAASKA